MAGSKSETRSGNWEGTVLLLSGGSHMGKSFFAKTVLATEYNAVYRQIDNVYTAAVNDARMVGPSGSEELADEEKRNAERDARRRARDRNWPSDTVKADFFASYKKQIRQACREAFAKKAPMVLEGGSLRNKEEVEIAARYAREIYGADARVIRITVEVPYDRWLQNRVNRMLRSGVKTTQLSKLSLETYTAEAKAATPKPNREVVDHKVHDVDEVRRLMSDLDRR